MAGKRGRKKLSFDKDTFEKLCGIQCTKDEICEFLGGIDEKTLTRMCEDEYGVGFKEIYQKKSAQGKISLRRAQFKIANTNATMAIFLGKQYLGQKDIVVTDDEISKVEMLLNRIESEAIDNDNN